MSRRSARPCTSSSSSPRSSCAACRSSRRRSGSRSGWRATTSCPFSKTMAKVSPRLHTPVATCIIVGALAAIPFIQFAGAAVIAVGATASIYFSYLLGNLAFMRARAKGWPKTKAPFSLGGWGKVVNVVAILWGAAMLLNFLTPSPVNSALRSERRGRLVHADHLEPEADPDRLLRRRGAARRLQDRLPEQDPGDLDRVLADRRSSARSTTSPSRRRSRSSRCIHPRKKTSPGSLRSKPDATGGAAGTAAPPVVPSSGHEARRLRTRRRLHRGAGRLRVGVARPASGVGGLAHLPGGPRGAAPHEPPDAASRGRPDGRIASSR